MNSFDGWGPFDPTLANAWHDICEEPQILDEDDDDCSIEQSCTLSDNNSEYIRDELYNESKSTHCSIEKDELSNDTFVSRAEDSECIPEEECEDSESEDENDVSENVKNKNIESEGSAGESSYYIEDRDEYIEEVEEESVEEEFEIEAMEEESVEESVEEGEEEAEEEGEEEEGEEEEGEEEEGEEEEGEEEEGEEEEGEEEEGEEEEGEEEESEEETQDELEEESEDEVEDENEQESGEKIIAEKEIENAESEFEKRVIKMENTIIETYISMDTTVGLFDEDDEYSEQEEEKAIDMEIELIPIHKVFEDAEDIDDSSDLIVEPVEYIHVEGYEESESDDEESTNIKNTSKEHEEQAEESLSLIMECDEYDEEEEVKEVEYVQESSVDENDETDISCDENVNAKAANTVNAFTLHHYELSEYEKLSDSVILEFELNNIDDESDDDVTYENTTKITDIKTSKDREVVANLENTTKSDKLIEGNFNESKEHLNMTEKEESFKAKLSEIHTEEANKDQARIKLTMDNVVLLTNPVKPKTTQDTANKYNQSTPAKYTGAIPKVFKISAKSKKKKEILEQTKRPKPNLSVHKQSQSITKSASAADDAIGIQTAVAAAKVNENLSTNNLPVPTFTIDIDNAAYGPRDPPLELWPNMELSDSKAKANNKYPTTESSTPDSKKSIAKQDISKAKSESAIQKSSLGKAGTDSIESRATSSHITETQFLRKLNVKKRNKAKDKLEKTNKSNETHVIDSDLIESGGGDSASVPPNRHFNFETNRLNFIEQNNDEIINVLEDDIEIGDSTSEPFVPQDHPLNNNEPPQQFSESNNNYWERIAAGQYPDESAINAGPSTSGTGCGNTYTDYIQGYQLSRTHLAQLDDCMKNKAAIILPGQIYEFEESSDNMSYIIELYNFPDTFKTYHLLNIYKEGPRYIKWCDSSHCLLVCNNFEQANRALEINHPMVKSRPLLHASPLSTLIACRCILEPAWKRQREFVPRQRSRSTSPAGPSSKPTNEDSEHSKE